MTTPKSSTSTIGGDSGSRKRPRAPENREVIELSASPDLEVNKGVNMKRTPQPTFTQSKLTSMLNPPPRKQAGPAVLDVDANSTGTARLPPEEMDISTAPSVPPLGDGLTIGNTAPTSGIAAPTKGPSPPVTTDILMKALKENAEFIIRSFTSNLGALFQRVETNTANISANATVLDRHETVLAEHQSDLGSLSNRVRALERGDRRSGGVQESRAALTPQYLHARRSVRLWPVEGNSDADLWSGVGDFLHGTLAINEQDMGQDDIESVARVIDGGFSARAEVLVTFFDEKKRDIVMSSSTNLATCTDHDGKPTAGIRLEIPDELADSFRLLSRFGTRLRARHGPGTKRHIKFDDFSGSLYSNVKLPGDESWTRVTVPMARDDLQASLNEENENAKKRLASKLVPGPRERLSRPLPAHGPLRSRNAGAEAPPKHPRWAVPDRGTRPRV